MATIASRYKNDQGPVRPSHPATAKTLPGGAFPVRLQHADIQRAAVSSRKRAEPHDAGPPSPALVRQVEEMKKRLSVTLTAKGGVARQAGARDASA